MSTKKNIVYTDLDKCVGCNKCVRVCPQFEANKYVEGKIEVNSDYCVACGECIKACTHEARQYNDDTDLFFNDLKKGLKISLIVAPAFLVNYPKEYKSILGWLKGKGIDLIYDVSFGADITTLLYMKALQENNLKCIIAQPCPVVVNSIECYYVLYCCVFEKI